MLSDRLHLRDVRNTSTFRLTLLLGAVFAIGLAALIVLIYLLSVRELTVRTDHILERAAAALPATPSETLPYRVEAEVERNSSGLNYIALQSADGDVIAGNLRVASDFPIGKPVNVDARPGRHPPIRVLAIRAPTGETILFARDITPILDLRARVTLVLIASGLGIAVLVLVVGAALSLAPLRRVRDLQETSREIAAGRLDRRMPVSRRGDELDLFAGTVNTMVEEVERVVAQVKEVTDAIAHDLRTPLTRVRAQLHRARLLPDADPRLTAIADAAIADLDQVLDRFAALLRISELEAAGRRAGFARVPLDPLITAVFDLYEPLAEERGIVLRSQGGGGLSIECDQQLLFEALSNLVDNAIKFTAPGGHVAIGAQAGADGPEIMVRDDGPGLPATDRQAVLRRFHRGTDAAGIPGTGLGLSVVAAIVHLHGFALALDDAAPGLLVRIGCGTQ